MSGASAPVATVSFVGDERSRLALVTADTRLNDVEAFLAPHDSWLGPLSPGAKHLTVREFLEGSYQGLHAISLGRLEPLCVSLEATTASGAAFASPPGPRSAAGPDLLHLVLGRHGRLASVQRAMLRTRMLPHDRKLLSFTFSSFDTLRDALFHALADGVLVSRVRLQSVEGRVMAEFLCEAAGALLDLDVTSLLRRARAAGATAGVMPTRLATSPFETEASWPAIGAALAGGAVLSLHRLAMDSAVVVGPVEGRPLGGPDAVAHTAPSLFDALGTPESRA